VISWRYHVVSIVAVVLAFGLGILAGTAVVNERLIEVLQANTDRAQQERDEARAEAAVYQEFVAELRASLRDDQLIGRNVVVVTMEGLDLPADRVLEELGPAGAAVPATLRATRRLADPASPQDLEALRAIVGTTATDPMEVAAVAAEALATRLAEGPPPDGDDDLLASLLDGGFLTADRDVDREALRGIGGVSQAFVLAAGGGRRDDLPSPAPVLLPLAERLVLLDAPVAVVGPTEDAYGLVAAVRQDPQVPDCSVLTVDHIDTPIGGIAFVMGLERLLVDPDPGFRSGGDYGIQADALVPGAEPPATCRE
jgi:Copper transport outer membrane protein, MctB